MARTTQEIYNAMIASKVTYGLPTNNNPMSVINRLLYVFALTLNTYENILDKFKADVTTITSQAAWGSKEWIRRKIFEFQYSATVPQLLSFDASTYKIGYTTINPNLRIIKQCSLRTFQINRIISIKVCKGVVPNLIPLSDEEKLALSSYLDKICPAGQSIDIRSLTGDDLNVIAINVYYDPQYYSSAEVVTLTTTKIEDYVYNTDFNGKLNKNSLQEAIRSIPGIIDATQLDIRISTVFNNYSQPFTLEDEAELYSGYVRSVNIANIYPIAII
jgi:hypothetical protein